MNHSYYLPWGKEGEYKYILCRYKYYGVEGGLYYRPISIIFISRRIISVCIYHKGGETKGFGMMGEKTYGGKHAKLLLFPNQNPFNQLPLFTICNLTDYYIPSYTICQRVAPAYFKFLPLAEPSFFLSLILQFLALI